jgi:hypothetical protein
VIEHVSKIALQLRVALGRSELHLRKRFAVVRADPSARQIHVRDPDLCFRVTGVRSRAIPASGARVRIGQCVNLDKQMGYQQLRTGVSALGCLFEARHCLVEFPASVPALLKQKLTQPDRRIEISGVCRRTQRVSVRSDIRMVHGDLKKQSSSSIRPPFGMTVALGQW